MNIMKGYCECEIGDEFWDIEIDVETGQNYCKKCRKAMKGVFS